MLFFVKRCLSTTLVTFLGKYVCSSGHFVSPVWAPSPCLPLCPRHCPVFLFRPCTFPSSGVVPLLIPLLVIVLVYFLVPIVFRSWSRLYHPPPPLPVSPFLIIVLCQPFFSFIITVLSYPLSSPFSCTVTRLTRNNFKGVTKPKNV